MKGSTGMIVWSVALIILLVTSVISSVNADANSKATTDEERRATMSRIIIASIVGFISFFVMMFGADAMKRS